MTNVTPQNQNLDTMSAVLAAVKAETAKWIDQWQDQEIDMADCCASITYSLTDNPQKIASRLSEMGYDNDFINEAISEVEFPPNHETLEMWDQRMDENDARETPRLEISQFVERAIQDLIAA